MDCEGYVLQHVETVGCRDAGEDEVDGEGAHLLVCQHEDVEEVEHGADAADGEGERPVHRGVGGLVAA